MIKIENLVKRYGNIVALDHLNLEIPRGKIFGLLGPNGCGKTTAINCLLSLLQYDKGNITVEGKQMSPGDYEIKRKIGIVPQEVAVFQEFTVWENIDYFCGLYVADRKLRQTYVEEALAFAELQDYRKMRPGQLSGGLLRRLNIACGVAHKPEIIILDEPTVAVDPQSRNKILEGICQMNREGATVIYTSHYMEEVEQICACIAVLDHGRCIARGTKDELKSMIKTGERITVHGILLEEGQLREIRELPHVFSTEYREEKLVVRCGSARHNLMRVLGYLQEREIAFGEVYSELPTLNDVFLELTGKALRD